MIKSEREMEGRRDSKEKKIKEIMKRKEKKDCLSAN